MAGSDSEKKKDRREKLSEKVLKDLKDSSSHRKKKEKHLEKSELVFLDNAQCSLSSFQSLVAPSNTGKDDHVSPPSPRVHKVASDNASNQEITVHAQVSANDPLLEEALGTFRQVPREQLGHFMNSFSSFISNSGGFRAAADLSNQPAAASINNSPVALKSVPENSVNYRQSSEQLGSARQKLNMDPLVLKDLNTFQSSKDKKGYNKSSARSARQIANLSPTRSVDNDSEVDSAPNGSVSCIYDYHCSFDCTDSVLYILGQYIW